MSDEIRLRRLWHPRFFFGAHTNQLTDFFFLCLFKKRREPLSPEPQLLFGGGVRIIGISQLLEKHKDVEFSPGELDLRLIVEFKGGA